MKAYKLIVLMSFASLNMFAQYVPSGCNNASASMVNPSNSAGITFDFNKKYLACDNVGANAYSGFTFKAQYSIANTTGIKDIFRIRIGTNDLLLFRLNDKKIEVQRDVIHRPCMSWSNGVCQTFGTVAKGTMTFGTWDNEFIESNTGWIYIKLVDNGMQIKVSNNENGPYKTEFNYEGLHLSGVDQEFADNSSIDDATLYVFPSSTSNITLTNITFVAGRYTPVSAVLIDDGLKSPETNFPAGGGSGARMASANVSPEQQLADAIERQDALDNVMVYPVPAQDILTLDFPEMWWNTEVELSLVTLVGKVLFNGYRFSPSGREEVDVSLIEPGTYFLITENNERRDVKRVVIE